MLIGVLWFLYNHGHSVLHTLWNAWNGVLNTCIDLPLQEFYRNAPAVLGGWEGQSLPGICARITFHGDEAFWGRNVQECERIFSYKEEHYMRIVKPGVYGVLVVVVIYVIRMLVREHALHRRQPQNRDMVETYHAIQILLRQFKRHQHHSKEN